MNNLNYTIRITKVEAIQKSKAIFTEGYYYDSLSKAINK